MSATLNYRLIEKLGAGAMGQIYKAEDTRLNRFVAIKILPPDQAGDPERQRRFIQEARSASALNHPNIVTIHNIINEGEMLYIVMEYIVGKTLHDTIPIGGLPVPQVVRWAAQMADALSVAHAAGVIHRDLKPANVMITESGLVKILDFGLAKWTGQSAHRGVPTAAAATAGLGPSSDETAIIEASLTVEGSILGTLNYMAPEQAEGKRVDARADVFSFGAVLYEMITGRRAFVGDSPVAILSAVLRDDVAPIRTLKPDVPPELEQIAMRCLRKAPQERWESMSEVQFAIQELRHKQEAPPVIPVTTAPTQSKPSQNRSRRLVFAAAGLVTLAVALSAGWWWSSSRHAPQQQSGQSVTPVPVQPPAAPAAAPADSAANQVLTPPKPLAPPKPATAPPASVDQSTASAAPVPENKPAAPAVSVTLNDALPFRIILAEDVPADATGGQTLAFRVADGLQIGGTTVIAAGSTVTGEVLGEAGKKKFLGIGGNKMNFRLLSAESADNEKIRIRATSGSKGDGPSARPFDTGKGAKTKNLAAARGTEYIAYIDGEQTVSVHK